jgi:P27 family predicted phage terminase small subunit
VGRELVRAGVISRVDRAVLALYCQAWARWVEAERQLAKNGAVAETPNGLAVQSVYMQIANRAMEQVRRYAAELGLTPAARTRVRAQPVEREKSLAEILFEGVVTGG